jgi:adenine-specific DNA-methyltransferase
MSTYDHLTREQLIALLQRREREASYGLVWERKEIEPERAINDDFVALDLDRAYCCGDGPWQNLIIEGDNFDALRYLRMTHAGKVKCIYIDPPYNTGNRDFVYNDHFFDKTHRFRHSVWLEFMYRRLVLARDLLHPAGSIFVSIDDNELFPLGMLMNRVFGEKNFVANVIWHKVFSPKNTAKHFSMDHDYILVYAADGDKWRPNLISRTQAQDGAYKNTDDDARGVWTSGDLSARNYYGEGTYSVTCPSGRIIEGPPNGRYWVISEKKFKELDTDKRIWWGKNGDNMPRLKRFLSEVKAGIVPQTLWAYGEVGHTQDAKKELLDILEFEDSASVFSTPKPVRLMERILRIATQQGDLVLDFFAGSGTTAQAVLKLNAEDGGTRRFILVSNSEATMEEPDKNLCRDVCAERVRRIMRGYRNRKGEDLPGLGSGFAYLTTRLHPRHRLDVRLDHGQVWRALQMLHDHPLAAGATIPLSWSAHSDHGLAYLTNLRAESVARLKEHLAGHAGEAVVYSWAADRLEALLPGVTIRPIPQTLAERFGRRRNNSRNNGA